MDDITRPPRTEDLPAREGIRSKGPAEGFDRHLETESSEGELSMVDPDLEPERAEGGRRRKAKPGKAKSGKAKSGKAKAAPARGATEGGEAEGAADDGVPPVTDPGELSRVLLAVLLVARDSVSRLRLAQVCNVTQQLVTEGLERLREDLEKGGMPIRLSPMAESVRLLTAPEMFPYLERLRGVKKADRLSPAALETLAVVAYRQPVMRAEIEAIRGVKVGPTLHTLLDHKLIDVVGRADVPGRPLQYGTTQHFLDRFGLASLDDLPSVGEFKSLG